MDQPGGVTPHLPHDHTARSRCPNFRDSLSAHDGDDGRGSVGVPPIVDQPSWEAASAELRSREKAATRELDAIAVARRRLPMVELPEYTLSFRNSPRSR